MTKKKSTDNDVLHNLVFQFTMADMMEEGKERDEKMLTVKALWREFGIRHGWVENGPT